ncbi:MAG: sugar phosphate isomerase/epimerase [Betaproteobacteria bacterium]|nr:sugar phosphate isomerase/epimerase [Betaproteobacteria bacterium]
MNILHNRIALHTWTLDTTPLADALRIAREAGYNGVELRLVDFQRARKAGLSEDATVKLVRDADIKVAVIGTESGLLFAEGDELKRLFGSLRYVSEKAKALDCDVIMAAPGLNTTGGMAGAKANLKAAAEITGEFGLNIGLEFNSRHPLVRTVDDGMEIVDAVNMKNCGLLIDTYHLHCSGGNAESFKHVPLDKIITFQFSDAPPGPPSDARTPVDRLPPGKGVAPFVDIFKNLMAMGYQGYMSYEAPNPAQWNRSAEVVAKEGVDLVRGLLARAEQGR